MHTVGDPSVACAVAVWGAKVADDEEVRHLTSQPLLPTTSCSLHNSKTVREQQPVTSEITHTGSNPEQVQVAKTDDKHSL